MPIATLESAPWGNVVTRAHDDHSSTWSRSMADIKAKGALLKDSSLPGPAAPCLIHDYFIHQARVSPSAPAVQCYQDQAVTYADLDAFSNRIAQGFEIQPRTIVPICMDMSVDFVAAILAILKSGAAYVILDPTSPVERNHGIVEDSNTDIVVVDQAYSPLFTKSITLDKLLNKEQTDPASTSVQDYTAVTDPAYLIYTSGSTGAPKGVILTHEAASHGIANFSLRGKSRWLLFYNPIFSAAQRTILATLSKGACLCLAPREKLATDLVGVIRDMQIDSLGITPSGLALLPSDATPASLKQITTVGEPLAQKVADEWADKVELRVSYGLSECAQLNFSRRLHKGDNPRIAGKPSDTTTPYILEPGSFRRLPLETQGELCLAGPQLAQGYHNRPEQTEKSFFKNPFGEGMIYRTGDLAVRTHDGSFKILGRLDYQIKINGQRLEPDEVAATISKDERIASNVVVGITIKGRKSLVAAIVQSDSTEWSSLVSELRGYVQSSLPSYMVPSYWLRLNALPMNANGKVDVGKIRRIAEDTDIGTLLAAEKEESTEAAALDKEHLVIRDVWAEVLQMEASAIHGSNTFTALGGSSIDAIQVVRRLRAQQLHVELSDIVRQRRLCEIEVAGQNAGPTGPIDPPRFGLVNDLKTRKIFEGDPGAVDAYPLTQLQASLLASTLDGNDGYLYQRVYDVRHIDLVKLKLAVRTAFQASEILRTTYVSTDAGYFQVVRGDFWLPWEDISMSLDEYRQKDKANGVKFGKPFVRFGVLDQQLLVVSMHHSLFDFWSHHFFFDDVSRLYLGFEAVHRPPFRRFVGYIQNHNSEASDDFWRKYLEHAEPTFLNTISSVEKNNAYRFVPFNVKNVMGSLGTTSGSIIYSAWALILARHTGHAEATFATAVSGRELPLEGIEALDGPSLTLIPQRIQVDPKRPFNEAIKDAHNAFWDVLKHSQHGMRHALSAANMRSGQLFDTLVNILVKDTKSDDHTKIVFQPFGPKPSWQTEWTTLNVEEHADGFQFHLVAAMPELRITFILDELAQILNVIRRGADTVVAAIDPIGTAEREWLSSGTHHLSAKPRTLHEGFEKVVQRYPDNVALQWQSERSFTYKELNELSNQTAAYLKEMGIQVGDLVPLLLDKSPRMIIAILAVLKAGAAYVPLSPANPVERNDFILREVGAVVVLTETTLKDHVPSGQAHPVFLDSVDTSRYPTSAPAIDTSPDQLAYVIYTSGSTGQPKGVMIKHRAVSAAIDSIISFEGRGNSNIKTLQFSNYVFDVSVYDIFVALSSGHTLCMAPSDRLLSDLAGVINEMEVSHCFLTPTVARLLDPKAVPTLKALTVGGESVTSDIIKQWSGDHQLVNGYGPTETSILATMKDIRPDTDARDIGRPLPTVQAFIIEPHGYRLVPWGAVGELCFAGPQLGDGYLARPEQTASSFLKYDIAGVDHIYRTGDLGRWLANGDIEYLGRKDNQIKINGYRVELAEIEHALLTATCIKDAVVVKADLNGKSQIVAFVVLTSADLSVNEPSWKDFPEDLETVKRSMRSLAHYMMPKYVLILNAMPKLPSGKSDRKVLKAKAEAMPAKELAQFTLDSSATGAPHQVPETEEQVVLCGAWASVLGLDEGQCGLESDFLTLGGDSITAINLVSFMRKRGYVISVGNALSTTSLKGMAELLETEHNQDKGAQKAFEEPEAIKEKLAAAAPQASAEYFYSCPPGQSEFLSQGARKEQFWVVMAVRRLPEGTRMESWLHTATRLAEANDILRTTFTKYDGHWYGAVLKDASPIIKIVDVKDEIERAAVVDEVWSNRFKYGHPFISYTFMRHPEVGLEVIVKMDHGLYDGTLLRIFDQHFKALQHDLPLPDNTPFRDFATHLYALPKSRATDYWTAEENCPTDFRYPRVLASSISDTAVLTAQDLNVDQFCKDTGSTPSTVFQAAYQLWLGVRSGSQDVSFDYLYTGRNVDVPNPQSVNGTCASFLPLRARLEAAQSVKEYLSTTQTRFWQATENGVIPIQQIYDANNISREDHGNTALFLFQPFDPPPPPSEKQDHEDMQWVVMAKSKITMPQPYAIVFEIVKLAAGWKFKIGYDSKCFSAEDAQSVAEGLLRVVKALMEAGPLGKTEYVRNRLQDLVT